LPDLGIEDALLPFIDFGFCAFIGWHLNMLAKIVGGLWFVVGLAYIVVSKSGLRKELKMITFDEL